VEIPVGAKVVRPLDQFSLTSIGHVLSQIHEAVISFGFSR
jgi:hypothetical protein